MNLLSLGALLVASTVAAGAQQQTTSAPTVHEDNEVTLTGCVVKGDGGYVLSVDSATPPATATRILYWLKDDDDLEEHAGHRVEVKGKADKDIDKGEISYEIENGMLELEFKADNRKVTVKVPHGSPVAAPVGTSGAVPEDKEKDLPFTVRTVDVKSVKMLANSCQ